MGDFDYTKLLINQNQNSIIQQQKPTLVGFTKKSDVLNDLKKYGGIKPTDFALAMGALFPNAKFSLINRNYTSTPVWVMDSSNNIYLRNGELQDFPLYNQYTNNSKVSTCPTLKIAIPNKPLSKDSSSTQPASNEDYILNAFNSLTSSITKAVAIGKSYRTINVGEYPQTIVSKSNNHKLEEMYNKGAIKGDLTPTGKFYQTPVGLHNNRYGYSPVHKLLPEFEYKNQKYVRVMSNVQDEFKYSNGMVANVASNRIVWIKVEPVKYIIRNWDNLPQNINPNGDGTCNYLDLRSEKAITGGINFFINSKNSNDCYVKNFLNGNTSEDNIEEGDFQNRGFINDSMNLTQKKSLVYEIPKSQDYIPHFSFDGCVALQKIVIGNQVSKVESHAFSGTKFKYIYSQNGQIVLDVNYDKSLNSDFCFKIEDLKSTFLYMNDSDLYELVKNPNRVKIAQLFKKEKIFVNYQYLDCIERTTGYDFWFKEANLKFFKELNPQLKNVIDGKELFDYQIDNLFNFLVYLGCVDGELVLDKQGKETQTPLCQKAVYVGQKLLGNYGNNKIFWDALGFLQTERINPSINFLKFVSHIDENGKLDNMELLISLEKKYKGIIAQSVCNFDNISKMRKGVNKDGKIFNRSWEDCLKLFYCRTEFRGVDKDNEDIASLFAERGQGERSFKMASQLRKKAIVNKIPHHIISSKLAEKTILEQIEDIKQNSELKLSQSKKLLESIYKKQFSYEFLDKYDPQNFIMGLLTSCCAVIDNPYYGSKIVRATVVSPNVQNIVVKDGKNEIVAKCSLYVNKDFGYGVVNDFEINEKFKTDESYSSGYYYSKNGKRVEERQAIFNTFMRAINAFVKKYDQENPTKPIRQINVGMGYNRLKKQTEELENSLDLLPTPSVFSFEDTYEEQRILYKKDSNLQLQPLSAEDCNKIEQSESNCIDYYFTPLDDE